MGKDKKDRGSRPWCFTLNNWTKDEYENILKAKCTYLIVGKEIGKRKKLPHLQGYIVFKDCKTFTAAKKNICERAHMKPSRGTPDENYNYCSKDGDFIEVGKKPIGMGARTDLKDVTDKILAGKITCDEILMSDPALFHQYGRTFDRIEALLMQKMWRKDFPRCIWIFGKTGSGKSHLAFMGGKLDLPEMTPDNCYVWEDDCGWQDGYKQQEYVVINEFRGEIPYRTLLKMCDRWPNGVKRRYLGKIPFTSKTIIITSSLPPDCVYNNLSAKDSLDQLFRRFEVYEMLITRELVKYTQVPRGNTSPGLCKLSSRIMDTGDCMGID